MLEIDLRADGAHSYAVTLTREDHPVSEHVVRVPGDLIERWGLGVADEPPVVRAAVELLVDHHGSALPADFGLTDPGVAYEGFLDQLELATAT